MSLLMQHRQLLNALQETVCVVFNGLKKRDAILTCSQAEFDLQKSTGIISDSVQGCVLVLYKGSTYFHVSLLSVSPASFQPSVLIRWGTISSEVKQV